MELKNKKVLFAKNRLKMKHTNFSYSSKKHIGTAMIQDKNNLPWKNPLYEKNMNVCKNENVCKSENVSTCRKTFVTMFFDLARYEGVERRNYEKYQKDAEFLLSQNINLVVFTEKEMADYVYEYRKTLNLLSKTIIHTMCITELPYFCMLAQITEARRINPMLNGSSIKDTPIYTVLIWSKLAFMKSIVESNPFASTRFAWIDFGISYVAITQLGIRNCTNSTNTEFREKKLIQLDEMDMPDIIKLLTLRPIFPDDLSTSPYNNEPNTYTKLNENIEPNIDHINLKHYYSLERGLVAFGFVTGSGQAWRLFYVLFDKMIHELIKQDLAPSEQQIVPILMMQNQQLFTTYKGDYNGILCNYNSFSRSIENIVLYTMIHARNQNRLDISHPIGKEIFLALHSYDDTLENDRFLILIFLNELFYSCVLRADYESAQAAYLYYTILKQKPNYNYLFSRLPYEFIFE